MFLLSMRSDCEYTIPRQKLSEAIVLGAGRLALFLIPRTETYAFLNSTAPFIPSPSKSNPHCVRIAPEAATAPQRRARAYPALFLTTAPAQYPKTQQNRLAVLRRVIAECARQPQPYSLSTWAFSDSISRPLP